jgi:large subunit ribosomal protein L27Ae
MRGHVSMGHGRVGRHRKHPGGRGNAGGITHHRIMMVKYHPGYFGKKGQRHFHYKKNQYFRPTINLDKLWTLVPEEARKNSTSAKAAVIDVTKAGFFKVLGKGELPKVPMVLRAKEVSYQAEKRIKAAGGAVQLVA